MNDKTAVAIYSDVGEFEVLDAQLLEAVSGGFSFEASYRSSKSNGTCDSEVNQRCNNQGTNYNTCVQANPACGADTVCSGAALPIS